MEVLEKSFVLNFKGGKIIFYLKRVELKNKNNKKTQ
jgi:hypothetical protein